MGSADIRVFPLSSQQVRLWRRLSERGGHFCAQTTISLEGGLNAEALKIAVHTVVNQHEALRTTFRHWPGIRVPLQVVADVATPRWREVGLTGCDASQQDEGVRTLLEEERSRPVDFEQGPLVSAVLVILAAHAHLLIITIPSMCADAQTLQNLFNGIGKSYAGHRAEDETPGEPFQYPDFSEWQRELQEANDSEAEAGRAYWNKQVKSLRPTLTLPFKATGQPSFQRVAHFSVDLDEPLSGRLDEVAVRYETSTKMLLLACWNTLLFRLTGEQSVVNGYICNERSYDALSGASGLFAQCLPVQNHLSGAMPFSGVLSQADEAVHECEYWQEYFAEEQDDLSTTSDLQAGFEYLEWPPAYSVAGVRFRQENQYCHLARFEIKLSAARHKTSIMLELHYDSECFEPSGVENIAGCLSELLKSVAQNPEALVADLNLLTDSNRQRLLETFNQTVADYPRHSCFHTLFEEQAALAPDSIAVVCEGRRLSYGELNGRANQLASILRQAGVVPDTPVCLLMDRSVDLITGLLAILKAGGAYVPLNPDDPQPRLKQQVSDAGIHLAVTQEALVPIFTDFECKLICIDRDQEMLRREADANLENLALPQSLAYVIYTSGSTGASKGVGITHQSLINYVYAIGRKLQPEALDTGRQPTYATVSTISADLGNTAIFPSLASGGCLHILSYETATNGNAFAKYVTDNIIDVLKIVPSHLNALLEVEPEGSKRLLPEKWLILGGEALSLPLIKRLRGGSVPCRVLNHYGPTESTVGSLTFDLAEWGGSTQPDAIIPIGRPLANTRVYILNRSLHAVPIGVAGEMYLSGDGLARGYLHAPMLTAERFLPDPFSAEPGQRMYRTGDSARFQLNGNVEFLGRRDEQVKLHGYRIELAEVAAVLSEATGVRQAVVAVREDVDGEKRLTAYVVLDRATGSPDVSRLRDHAKQFLPEYMIPAAFVAIERIPLTRNGKIDRRALPAPGEAHAKTGREHVEPRTRVEKELALLWEEVLRVAGVGVHDNFFELGGDSVLAIQVITGANRAGLYFSVKDMFEDQTIAALAEHVSVTPPMQTEPSKSSLPKLDHQIIEKIAGKVSFEG